MNTSEPEPDEPVYDIMDYPVIRDALENDEEISLPFRVLYTHPVESGHRVKSRLAQQSFEWHYEEENTVRIKIRSRFEAAEYVELGELVDYRRSYRKADRIIQVRDRIIRANKMRKLVFQKPFPVPHENDTVESLARSFMQS